MRFANYEGYAALSFPKQVVSIGSQTDPGAPNAAKWCVSQDLTGLT